ncbi:hypothetical protein NKH52_16030 [Mesorhizobium sp. M1066]|uniref:DUF6963 family protein n=1 Tax=unclassified Mesorhizobium TaxID=325217 RepID=UPI0033390DB1
MTIGIAACGPNAGLAIYRSLRAVERVGSGSIGGFATFAAITVDGKLLRHETQRGGTSTLFIEGEITGTDPPPQVAAATRAAVISSGPDRPEPEKFLSADPLAGLVTGHRMPIASGVDGIAVNQQVLDLMKGGQPAQVAVDTVMDRNPEVDAGLIAIDRNGQVYGRNSARVLRRPDLAEARASREGASVVVFYNAIRPRTALAGLVTEIALDTMLAMPMLKPDGQITVDAGIPVIAGRATAIYCDANGVATHVTTNELEVLTGRRICTGIYLGSPVYKAGKLIGHTMLETIITFQDGKLASMGGKKFISFGYRNG